MVSVILMLQAMMISNELKSRNKKHMINPEEVKVKDMIKMMMLMAIIMILGSAVTTD
mgnify:CR=1 FL=1